MKKIFKDRGRLTVYLEASDVVRLTAIARSEGKVLVEWARDTLLSKLEDRSVLPHGAISEGDGLAANPVATAHESTCGPQKWLPNKKTCKHGVERGYHCWQCGGVADV